jgi:hypothetical protein
VVGGCAAAGWSVQGLAVVQEVWGLGAGLCVGGVDCVVAGAAGAGGGGGGGGGAGGGGAGAGRRLRRRGLGRRLG